MNNSTVYDSKDIQSGTKKGDEKGYAYIKRNLSRPVTEEERARVGDQPSPKVQPGQRKLGQRPFGKLPPSDPADEDAQAM
jgi:hypothetical protein